MSVELFVLLINVSGDRGKHINKYDWDSIILGRGEGIYLAGLRDRSGGGDGGGGRGGEIFGIMDK